MNLSDGQKSPHKVLLICLRAVGHIGGILGVILKGILAHSFTEDLICVA